MHRAVVLILDPAHTAPEPASSPSVLPSPSLAPAPAPSILPGPVHTAAPAQRQPPTFRIQVRPSCAPCRAEALQARPKASVYQPRIIVAPSGLRASPSPHVVMCAGQGEGK